MNERQGIAGDAGGRAELEDFEGLYRARFHTYLRVAEAISGDRQMALDAVQEGFANAIRHRRQFRGEASLSTWVWRCVVNAALAQRHPRLDYGFEDDVAATAAPDESILEPIRRLIATLPERQRLALFLRYYADMDYASIGAVLGVQTGTVGATLNSAHTTLRRVLEEARCETERQHAR